MNYYRDNNRNEMTEQEAIEILIRWENDTCTPEEKLLVEHWYLGISAIESDRIKKELAKSGNKINYELEKKLIWKEINGELPQHRNWLIPAAAAAALFIISLSYFSQYLYKQDLPPGGNRATLTLADGKQIDLDEVGNGNIALLPGMTIKKTDSGKIVYEVQEVNNKENETLSYNTISTPNGGQYQIMLPDSTLVILNAGSTLKYPTRFTKNERNVSLMGEAYFEVQKNPRKPFIVESTVQRIVVLGTHFNASCYLNEPAKTTLLEGKVAISQNNHPQSSILKPGEQATVNPQGISVQQVNAEESIAWKNGLFVFNQTPLKEALTQIGRWYDVDIDFSHLPDKRIDGEIPKNFTLVQTLDFISKSSGHQDIQLTIQGRRIINK